MYTYSFAQWLLFFYIYCFLGWVWESCYVSVKKRKWVNRGFMHGPFLPIYGSGAIMVLVTTLPVKDNMVLVFIFGMIGATLLEYFTGAVMEKMFRVRYWDYSEQPFNLNGYICLVSSIAWGFFSILMERYLHHPIETLVLAIPCSALELVDMFLTAGIAMDITQSFNEAMDLKEMLVNMTENSQELQRMRKRLDVIVAVIDEETRDFRQKAEEGRQLISERITEEKERYEQKVEKMKETKKVSARRKIEMNLERRQMQKKAVLNNLSARIGSYSDKILTHVKNKESGISLELEKVLNELKTLKSNIALQESKVSAQRNKKAVRLVKLLQRNPGAISRKYMEALTELKASGEKEDQN